MPAITAEFLEGLRDTVSNSEDSNAKRFLEKLFAKGDKHVTSFFTRLQNALTRDIPLDRVLNGYEKKILSESSTEFAQATIQRLDAKEKDSELTDREIREYNYAHMHEPPLEYQKDYNRRWFLGTGIQLAAIPATIGATKAERYKDDVKREKDLQKTGHDRSMLYDTYCKTCAHGKALLLGVLVVLVGDHAKAIGLSPAKVWKARGDELMEGLNDILSGLQGMRDLEEGKSK